MNLQYTISLRFTQYNTMLAIDKHNKSQTFYILRTKTVLLVWFNFKFEIRVNICDNQFELN